jgi:hypothetical protein
MPQCVAAPRYLLLSQRWAWYQMTDDERWVEESTVAPRRRAPLSGGSAEGADVVQHDSNGTGGGT